MGLGVQCGGSAVSAICADADAIASRVDGRWGWIELCTGCVVTRAREARAGKARAGKARAGDALAGFGWFWRGSMRVSTTQYPFGCSVPQFMKPQEFLDLSALARRQRHDVVPMVPARPHETAGLRMERPLDRPLDMAEAAHAA